MIAGLFPHEWLHPGGSGYWMYSGIFGGSAFLSGAIAMLLMVWRRHNCHVTGCWRLQWHTHPGHGHPTCRSHWWEDGSEHGLVHPSERQPS